jgi:hypothetical protein
MSTLHSVGREHQRERGGFDIRYYAPAPSSRCSPLFDQLSFSCITHMPLSVGDKLGPYEILAPIGVYKGDTRLDRIVAVKVSRTEISSLCPEGRVPVTDREIMVKNRIVSCQKSFAD